MVEKKQGRQTKEYSYYETVQTVGITFPLRDSSLKLPMQKGVPM